MAFVTELLPVEEKEKFNFPYTKYNGFFPGKEKWTIDRVRNVFLFRTETKGGGYEGTQEEEHYVLSINGEIVNFIAFPKWSGKDGKRKWAWTIANIRLQPKLENQRDAIKDMIMDSLKSYAYSFKHPENIVAVDFVFNDYQA